MIETSAELQADRAPDNAVLALVETLTKVTNNLGKWPADNRTTGARQYVLSAIMMLRGIDPDVVSDENDVPMVEDFLAELEEEDPGLGIGHGIPGLDEKGDLHKPFSPMTLPSEVE